MAMGVEGTTERRQFFLDRIHARKDADFEKRMQWRFHNFKISGKGACKNRPAVRGFDETNVRWVRDNVFKPIPRAVAKLGLLQETFGFSEKRDFPHFNETKFNPKLSTMVISAGHSELLSGLQFKDFIPELVETVTK